MAVFKVAILFSFIFFLTSCSSNRKPNHHGFYCSPFALDQGIKDSEECHFSPYGRTDREFYESLLKEGKITYGLEKSCYRNRKNGDFINLASFVNLDGVQARLLYIRYISDLTGGERKTVEVRDGDEVKKSSLHVISFNYSFKKKVCVIGDDLVISFVQK